MEGEKRRRGGRGKVVFLYVCGAALQWIEVTGRQVFWCGGAVTFVAQSPVNHAHLHLKPGFGPFSSPLSFLPFYSCSSLSYSHADSMPRRATSLRFILFLSLFLFTDLFIYYELITRKSF
uniref:Uncharacterized protein n=1 Tax=Physcomitrium patens TaxID=3218 RepID=A0A2K1K5Q6_PHYPA|nr:hypothetical protein PHYPA_011005 [Physcomitrium patens]